eukprot:Pompholyxophrys_punicea_v1_NODE_352_length_2174_cov_2.601603.p1 type:complete len:163 gc:universal NODE_352_length_2174_cov_2.601603:427-915(+)
MECSLLYSERRNVLERVDCELQLQIQSEQRYWHQFLERVVSVIKFLSSRGLPFRGSDQTIGSHNNGNYLGILELISEYDPFLKSHLEKYANPGRGRVLSFSKHLRRIYRFDCRTNAPNNYSTSQNCKILFSVSTQLLMSPMWISYLLFFALSERRIDRPNDF